MSRLALRPIESKTNKKLELSCYLVNLKFCVEEIIESRKIRLANKELLTCDRNCREIKPKRSSMLDCQLCSCRSRGSQDNKSQGL